MDSPHNRSRLKLSTPILILMLVLPLFILIIIEFYRPVRYSPRTQAEADCKFIAQAVIAYRNDHGEFPERGEVCFEGELLKRLAGKNGREKVYFESQKVFVNPWGRPYIVHFDNDGDGEVNITSGPRQKIINPVAVWTETENGIYVSSWE